MKKAQIFMPIILIGFLIIISLTIFKVYTYQNNSKEYYSIGFLQNNIIKNAYLGSEKVFYYYEKLLEYNEYKAVKEFSGNGGIPKSCNKKWKFNSECEPNFKEYFKETLSEKLDKKYKELNINQEIEVYFTDFNFPTGSNSANVNYEGKILVKKQPLINFQDLEKLKLDIKNCIQLNNMNNCNPQSSTGNIYKFKQKIAEILDENLEKEEIFLEFEVNTQDSGLRTSIF